MPRPGHADLAGAIKYGFTDLRPVLERASAAKTAAEVACGFLAKQLLATAAPTPRGPQLGDRHRRRVVACSRTTPRLLAGNRPLLAAAAEGSPVRCPDPAAATAMVQAIDSAREAGDTLGGVFEVAAVGVPAGLGSYVHWDRRLDTAIAAAVMSINAVKAVEMRTASQAQPGEEARSTM